MENLRIKILGIIILLLISSTTSYACLCPKPSFEKQVNDADEIFIGRIKKVEKIVIAKRKYADNSESTYWGYRYYFEVIKKWKGTNKSEFILENNGSSCDSYFDIHTKDILVYASNTSKMRILYEKDTIANKGIGVLNTSICTRTITSHYQDSYDEDIRELNLKFPNEIDLATTENSRIETYHSYLTRNSILKMMGVFIVFSVFLNLFQLYRKIKNKPTVMDQDSN